MIRALGGAGAADVAVLNRTTNRAAEAATLAGSAGRVGDADAVAGADLIINATSVGMGADTMAIDIALLRPDLVVADIVYHPLETSLLRAAASVGALTIDGLGMLVHQAVLQHELWTGQRPDPALLRRAAEAELAARSR